MAELKTTLAKVTTVVLAVLLLAGGCAQKDAAKAPYKIGDFSPLPAQLVSR